MDAMLDEALAAHGAPIFAYLVRMTGDRELAEELCQETFVRYLRHRSSIRATNGSLAPWLYRVATRLAIDTRRRKRTVPLERDPVVEDDVPERASRRELAGRIRGELEALAPQVRATFLLRARQGLTFREIAAVTGVSERAAKDRFRKARDTLLTRLAPLMREMDS